MAYGQVKLLIGKLMFRCYGSECCADGIVFVFSDLELKL